MDFFYPSDLPITGFIDEIRTLIHDNQVVIIAGDTGSGKTTQLPKICLQALADSPGIVGCTQPRRLAATSVTDRVKHEMGDKSPLVGSKIRFSDRTTEATQIKFMTDGILLAEIRQDPRLSQYRAIIIDEAHERSLNIDFLLGYLHRLLPQRPELKLVITSATIDTELFANHFGGAPVFTIPGRSYPVEITYRAAAIDDDDISYLDHCIETIGDVASNSPPGDILVFLPTERDIRGAYEIVRGRLPEHEVLPLFGRLQAKDQNKIFKSYPRPKVVIASNVAETSITVPGIRYVIDSGLARIASYHARSRTSRLPVTRISQASCNQRSGRCGRVGPGTCFRLYSEEDFGERTEFSIPEIQRTNLAEVILQMIQLDLGNPEDFPFLNPPKPAAIRDGYRTLRDLGAIDEQNRLTRYGKIMCSLPIDPTISRIIIEAEKNQCLTEITIIAAALAIADPQVRPAEKEQLADRAHQSFAHPGSDFSALLNIWTRFHRENKTFSWTKLKRFCTTHFLSFQRMREWFDLHEQLVRILKRKRSFNFNDSPASFETIHQALLSGLFRQCARRKKGLVYQNSGNNELLVFPGSHQFKKSGDLILIGALIETSKLYGLTVATIEPEWVEKVAKKFCTYSWSNPRWQKKTGRVVADESVSLQGLLLLSNRIVNFGARHRKNLPEARKIFIQKGLVEAKIREPTGFLEHNQALLATWRETEKQLRKRHIVMDDAALFDFYDNRLADHVYDRTSLLKHLKKSVPKQLFLAESDVLVNRPDDSELLNFPHTLEISGIKLKLAYSFDPGQEQDGITVHIPETHCHSINADIFDWLVPGLILEKTVYMLKGLPKSVRKKIIPVQATAERILDSVDYGQGDYITSLTTALQKFFRININRKDWPQTLPAHLSFFFVITDAAGRELRSGKSFADLIVQLREPAERIEHGCLKELDRKLVEDLSSRAYTTWDFSDIPERIPLYTENWAVAGYLYPALEPSTDGRSVTINFLDSHLAAAESNRKGTYLLLQQVFKQQTRELKKYCRLTLSSPSAAWLTATHGGSTAVQEAILAFLMRTIFGSCFPEIVSEKEFAELVGRGNQENFYARGKEIIDTIFMLLRLRKEVQDMIEKYRQRAGGSAAAASVYDDLTDRLQILMPGDFIDNLQPAGQDNLKRYLKSLMIRVERAHSNPAKDIKKRAQLMVHHQRVAQLIQRRQHWNNQCMELYEHYRHLIDEMHVSLFSPELKTLTAVSEKKLQDAWNQLQQMC